MSELLANPYSNRANVNLLTYMLLLSTSAVCAIDIFSAVRRCSLCCLSSVRHHSDNYAKFISAVCRRSHYYQAFLLVKLDVIHS